MKLSTFVAAAAVIGGSFLIPNPAEARNGWVTVGTTVSGSTTYARRLVNSGTIREFDINVVGNGEGGTPFKVLADCSSYRLRAAVEGGTWQEAMPGSVNESTLNFICR